METTVRFLDGVRFEADVPGLADARHREGVIRAAKNCLIHNTIPSIELALTDVEKPLYK